jgi:hypothetical protein
MSYHDLSECTLTADERLAEASKICDILKCVPLEELSNVERDFLERMESAQFCSVKQLFWLRDIKGKFD